MELLDLLRDAADRILAALRELEHGETWVAADLLLDLQDELRAAIAEADRVSEPRSFPAQGGGEAATYATPERLKKK